VIKNRIIFFAFIIFLIFPLKTNSEIRDSLLATVNNSAITKSDIYNEIKIILILNNLKFTNEQKVRLQKMAIKSTIKRVVKKNELTKRNITEYSSVDFNYELKKIIDRLNIDLTTLKNICKSNQLDFKLIEEQIKIELMWSRLVFGIYSDKLSINIDEIEEQLKILQYKTFYEEYLISEIVLKPIPEIEFNSKIEELISKINNESFEKVAVDLSISDTAVKGGDLGWLSENEISNEVKLKLAKTKINGLSEPLVIPQGIIIFKVRDKKKIEKKVDLENLKNQLVNREKTKMLEMYSRSLYDSIRRSTPIKFFE